MSQDSVDSFEAIFPSITFKQLLMFFEELEEKKWILSISDRRDEFVFYVVLKSNSKKRYHNQYTVAFLIQYE